LLEKYRYVYEYIKKYWEILLLIWKFPISQT
jgi:hypothetical protein